MARLIDADELIEDLQSQIEQVLKIVKAGGKYE